MTIDFSNTSNADNSSVSKADIANFDGAVQSQTSSSSSNGEAIPSVKQSSPIAEGQGIELKDGLSTGEEISNRQKRSLEQMSTWTILREVMVLAIHEEATERLKGTDVAIDDFFTTPYEEMDSLKRRLGMVRPMDLMEIPYDTISQRMKEILTKKESIDRHFINKTINPDIDGFVNLIRDHYSEVMGVMGMHNFNTVYDKFSLLFLPLLQELNFNEAGNTAIIENYKSMLDYNEHYLSNIFKLNYEYGHKRLGPNAVIEGLNFFANNMFLRTRFFIACVVNDWGKAEIYFNKLINVDVNGQLLVAAGIDIRELAFNSMELVFKYNLDRSDAFFNDLFGEIKRFGLMPYLFVPRPVMDGFVLAIAGITPAIKHGHHVAIERLLGELKLLGQWLDYMALFRCPRGEIDDSSNIFKNVLKKKDVKIVKLFLDKAETNRLREVLENDNYGIFKAAARFSSKEVIDCLFDATYRLGDKIGKEVQITVLQNDQVLQSAVLSNNKETVDALLKRARMFELSEPMITKGFTGAVHLDRHEIVEMFLEESKEPLRRRLLTNDNYKAFRYAVHRYYIEIVKILVDLSKEYELLPLMLEANEYSSLKAYEHLYERGYYEKNCMEMMKFLWGEVGQLEKGKKLQLGMLSAHDYSMFHTASDISIEAVDFLWNKAAEFGEGVQREMLQSSDYRAFMAMDDGSNIALELLWNKAGEFGAEGRGIQLGALKASEYRVFRTAFVNGDLKGLKFIWGKAGEFGAEGREIQLGMLRKYTSADFIRHRNPQSLKFILEKAEEFGTEGREMQLKILREYAVTMVRRDPKNFKFIWDEVGEFGRDEQLKLLKDGDGYHSLVQYIESSEIEYLWDIIKEFEEGIQREMLEYGDYSIFIESLKCNVELVKSILDRAQELGIEQSDMLKYRIDTMYFPFYVVIQSGNFEIINLLIDRAQEHGVLQGALESLYKVHADRKESMFFNIIMQQRFSPEEQMSLIEKVMPYLSIEKAVDLYREVSSYIVPGSNVLKSVIPLTDIEHCLRVAVVTKNEKVFKWIKNFVISAELQKTIGLYDQDLKEALAQKEGCTTRKKRSAGLKCIDSQEEEEITEEEKNKRIKELFNVNDAISRTNNIEFYGELLEFSQRASEDLSIDLDVEQRFIEKVKGINLDSLDPEIKDIIGELKEQIENKEETKNILKRSGVVEKIKKVAGDAGLTNTVFLDKKGRFQDFINTVNSNPKVMNHLGRVGRVSGWAMHGMMYKNLIGDLLSGNKEGVAINLGFIAGNPLLSKMAEAASARGLGLVSEGKVLLGQGLRMASPFLARVPSAFVIYDLVNQVKALKAGNQDALVGVIGDSIYIGVDAVEIGIEVAEVAGLLEGVSSVTGPIGAAIGAVIFIGTDIYMAVKTVEAEDKIIHLTGGEKFTEGLRAFLHMKMEESLEKSMKEKQANNELVKNAIKFLKDHPDIQRYAFPSSEAYEELVTKSDYECIGGTTQYGGCKGEIRYKGEIESTQVVVRISSNSTVRLDAKTSIKWSRARPNNPSEGGIFCNPRKSSDNSNEYEYATGTYFCQNAIGVSYPSGRTGNHTLIALGQGGDSAVGFKDSPNIFLVENGAKYFRGGNENDIFILQGDNISGKLDGRGGSNTIDLENFSQNAHQLIINLIGDLRKYGKIEISDTSGTLAIKNMNIVKARKGKRDIIKCNYNTRYVDGGGGENKDNPDVIDVFEPDDNMQLVVRPHTIIDNSVYLKNFTYTIFPDMEGSAQVNLLARYHHKTHNDFIFNCTIADLRNINIQNVEDINLNIADDKDVYTVKNITFSSLLPLSDKVFNFTISGIPDNSNYIFNDITQIKVGKHGNLYALQNTNKPIDEIVSDYPTIANRLNMTITVQSNNETIIVGHGKHEVLYNDPFSKNHLVGNGGENVYVVTLDEQKFWDNSFSGINIYDVDEESSIDTLDLRSIVRSLIKVLKAQVNSLEVTKDGNDLLLKPQVRIEESILESSDLKEILKLILKKDYLDQDNLKIILQKYILEKDVFKDTNREKTWEEFFKDSTTDGLFKKTLGYLLEENYLKTDALKSIFKEDIRRVDILEDILEKGLTVKLKNGMHWYQKLHIIIHNAPTKIKNINNHWELKPIPLIFDKKVKTIAITTNDIEKESEIIIQKQAGNYIFMRLRNDLVVMNDHSLGESNLCTVILSNFYQEPKMQTLSIKFNDVKISLQDEKDKIENAMAFCHQDLKVNSILSINDINSYDCFTFDSNKVLFLKSENDLMLLSDRGTLLISDYYSSIHNNLGLSIKLNDQTIKPEEFKSKADNPSAFKYYKPNNEQGLQIYHNQPENKHQIGLVDLKDKSTLDCDMRVIGDSLIVSSGGNTIVKVENWSYSSEEKEMIFAFSDALISNAKCVVSTCSPQDIIMEFEQEKSKVRVKKEDNTPHSIRHKRHKHHRDHNSHQRHRRSARIEDAVGKEESLEREEVSATSSSGARQKSWLNGGITLMKGLMRESVDGVIDRVKSVVSSVFTEDRVNLPSMEENIQFSYDVGYCEKDTYQHEGIWSDGQQDLTSNLSDFLSNENILLLHCVTDAMDKHPIKCYKALKNKGVEVVPSTNDVDLQPAVYDSLRKFFIFIDEKIKDLDSKEQCEIRNKIKKEKPEIIASLIRGKKYRGNVGLDDVLHKCKERFSELLPKLITGKYESYEIDKTLPFNVTVSNPDEQFEKAQMWVRKAELLKEQKNTSRPATGLNDISITMSSTQVMEI